jgi:ferrous iron transport protein A
MFTLLITKNIMTPGQGKKPARGSEATPGDNGAVALDSLPGGGGGKVTAIGGASTPLRQRLMELGITIGSEIRVVRKAPFGGPIEISVRGYRLSLRRSEARMVMIDSGD